MEAIYCHQCAQNNPIVCKFCRECGTPLHLQGAEGDKSRTCQDCGQVNPSFAKFCTQCSRPLVRTPAKGPGPDIPLILNNRTTTGGESCPGCGRSAELLSHLVEREGSKRASFIGPDGIVVEKPSWLEWNLREPQRKPSQKKGLFDNMGCLLLGLFSAPCVLVAMLRTLFPVISFANPLVLMVVIGGGLALVWVARSRFGGKASLDKAQFRWRRARYCPRCDAVFVTGETLYASPRRINDLLWNNPSQFV